MANKALADDTKARLAEVQSALLAWSYSLHTAKSYAYICKDFEHWCVESGRDPAHSLTAEASHDYIESLERRRGPSPLIENSRSALRTLRSVLTSGKGGICR